MQQGIINGSEKVSGMCPVKLQAMELALKAAGAEAVTTVFCDDSTRNVSGGHAAGMFSVLVSTTLPCSMPAFKRTHALFYTPAI